VQIALLRNAVLQAKYEELGVSQADLVQSGLLANPVFSAQVRTGGGGTGREFGVVQDFFGVLTRTPRMKVEQGNFDQTKLQTAHAVLKLAAEVKSAYYTAVSDAQLVEMNRTAAKAAEATAEIAVRQFQAGNISRLDQTREQAFYAQAALDVVRAREQLERDREALTRIMGLWGKDIQYSLPMRLPDVPAALPDPGSLEDYAIDNRLDLAAMGKSVETLRYALGYTRDYRYVGDVAVGVSRERDAEGATVTGPDLSIGLPIFDQGQARIARLEALLRQQEKERDALAVDIRSQVREARAKLLIDEQTVRHYRHAILPLNQKLVKLSYRYYNGMLVGVYELLRTKQAEIDAGRGYIGALRDYWLAHASLEQAIGGPLPVKAEVPPAATQPEASPRPQPQPRSAGASEHRHGGH
jgi:cobalt-zinc-cadmium efflux system outer membrane protein